MKAILFVVLLLFSVEVMCQENEDLKLPKPEEIERVEIGNNSPMEWYKPEELLKLLPRLVPSEGTYMTKGAFQRGTFILKNGKKVSWMVGDKGSILLLEGSKHQLFVLPREEKKRSQPKQAEPLFPIWDGEGKEGFIDINGNVVSKGADSVVQFSEGLAPVLIDGKWGYIDPDGKIAIKPRWKAFNIYRGPLMSFSEGLAAVMESVHIYSADESSEYYIYDCGYIDKTGEYAIKPAKRLLCGNFSEGLAPVGATVNEDDLKSIQTALTGYMDSKGNWAIKPKFVRAGNFKNGYALVSEGGWNNARESYEYYLIDKKGNKAVGVKDCLWREENEFHEGLKLAYSEKEKRYDGYIDKSCGYALKLPADIYAERGLSYFSQGLAAVYKLLPNDNSGSSYRQKIWGYIDTTGKVVIPFQYRSANPFSEGFATIQIQNDHNYIDLSGKIAFAHRMLSTRQFKNGLAFQMLHLWTISEKPNARNIYGYMNKQGKYVWLSPRAEAYLDKEWIQKNYIGPQKFR